MPRNHADTAAVTGTATARWLRRLGLALPLLMLAANLLAWLRWGTDLPFLDDWRAYNEGRSTSLALARLFEATNNTIAPVGLALDALAQRWLGGNPVAYQTLSMLGVLGSLLWLQWRLLGWALRQPLWQALAFGLCLFMLQSGSYWGEQNLAYHQALPLVALLGAAWLNFGLAPAAPWRLAGVGALGVVAGLSYVSGAVGALVMGLGWLALAWLMRGQVAAALRARAASGGAALALAGALGTALQIGLTRRAGADALGQSMRLTWPNDSDFWVFLAGKLGRASGHGFEALALEALWVAALALALLGAAALTLRAVAGAGKAGARWRRVALVWLPLAALVLAYLGLVSLGRAGLREAGVQGAEAVFRLAYGRFHFFWVTLLLPWAAAVLALALRRRAAPALAALLTLACGAALARGVFDVGAYYRSASTFRAGEIRCLSRQLGSGQPVRCPGFDMVGMPDWTRAYLHARAVGASFVRYLPIVEREGFGHDWLRWEMPADRARVQWHGAQPLADGWVQTTDDPQLQLSLQGVTPAPPDCRVLGVQLAVRAAQPGVAQLFYRRRGMAGYSELAAVRKPYAPDAEGLARLEFAVDSPTGFEPALRLDPADGPSRLQLLDLRVACRLSATPGAAEEGSHGR